MFDLPVRQLSRHSRTGPGPWADETVATFGHLAVIRGCRAQRGPASAIAVASYVTSAYWFTASTAFANSAVTSTRRLSDTDAGLRPADAPALILAECAGLVLALPILRRIARADAASVAGNGRAEAAAMQSPLADQPAAP
jgi:hypothetical protein